MKNAIEWGDVELFLAIQSGGSLSKAAVILGIQQSTVTRRLQNLEYRLDTALFVRRRNGVIPTPAGKRLIDPALVAQSGIDNVRRAFAADRDQGVDGVVTIATLHSVADYVISPFLEVLLSRHPNLRAIIRPAANVVDLSSIEADIAVRLVKPKAPDLIAKQLKTGKSQPFASPTLASKLSNDSGKWRWLSMVPEMRHPLETQALNRLGIEPQVQFSSGTSLIESIRNGIGVGYVNERIASLIGLKQVGISSVNYEVPLWLVAHSDLRRISRVDATWTWLNETFEGKVALE